MNVERSDRDIKKWDERLNEQNRRGWDNYIRRRIYLDQAREDEIWNICGEYIYVEEHSSANAVASIKLSRTNNDPIDLQLGTKIETVFINVYITNAALQNEWIDVIWGINFKYEKAGSISIAGGIGVTDVVPGTGATNLGKAEDAVHTSGDVGVMALGVRHDAGGALTNADGDYSVLQVDANGNLRVTGGGGGTEYTEDVATPNPIIGKANMMERDDALGALAPAEGDWASQRCTAEGALWTQDFNSDAILAAMLPDGHNVTVQEPLSIDDNGGSITVDGAVTAVDNGVAQPVIMITHANPDTDVTGADHACKRVLIRALTTNTGLTWVNFSAAAVDGTSYPLDTGDAISVPLTNTNLIHCLFKVGGEKVAVVYTN